MRNLGRCVLGVLAVALCQLRGAQLILFKCALGCLRVLVGFNMMAQYRYHTAETITYMEDDLDTFFKMTDIFLEFRVTKHICAKIDEQEGSCDMIGLRPRSARHPRNGAGLATEKGKKKPSDVCT